MMWDIKITNKEFEITNLYSTGKILAIDSGSLSLNNITTWNRFPSFRGADLVVLLDDSKSADLISSGCIDHAKLTYISGKGRFFCTESELIVHSKARLLAGAILDMISGGEAVENGDLLKEFYSIEFRNPLRIFCEILYIVKKYCIGKIRIPISSLSAAFIVRKLLNDGFPEFSWNRRRCSGFDDIFRISSMVKTVDIKRNIQGKTNIVTSITGNIDNSSVTLDGLRKYISRNGHSEIALSDRSSVQFWKFDPCSVYKFYNALLSCGLPPVFAFRMSFSFLYSHNVRLFNMVKFFHAGRLFGRNLKGGGIYILDIFRHPGVFFGAGVARENERVFGINRHNQPSGVLERSPLFQTIYDASGNISGNGFNVQSIKVMGAAQDFKKVAKGSVIISQPLCEEMEFLNQGMLGTDTDSLSIHFHPQDGPAATAWWERKYYNRNIKYTRGSTPASVRKIFGFSSTMLLQASIQGVVVSHLCKEEAIKLIWPCKNFRPGVMELDRRGISGNDAEMGIMELDHNKKFCANYESLSWFEDVLV